MLKGHVPGLLSVAKLGGCRRVGYAVQICVGLEYTIELQEGCVLVLTESVGVPLNFKSGSCGWSEVLTWLLLVARGVEDGDR